MQYKQTHSTSFTFSGLTPAQGKCHQALHESQQTLLTIVIHLWLLQNNFVTMWTTEYVSISQDAWQDICFVKNCCVIDYWKNIIQVQINSFNKWVMSISPNHKEAMGCVGKARVAYSSWWILRQHKKIVTLPEIGKFWKFRKVALKLKIFCTSWQLSNKQAISRTLTFPRSSDKHEQWIQEHQGLLHLAIQRRNRRRHRWQCIAPYAWMFPQPRLSWFEIHYADPNIPETYFRQQLRVNKNTFDIINILGLRIMRENSKYICFGPL